MKGCQVAGVDQSPLALSVISKLSAILLYGWVRISGHRPSPDEDATEDEEQR